MKTFFTVTIVTGGVKQVKYLIPFKPSSSCGYCVCALHSDRDMNTIDIFICNFVLLHL